MRKCVFLALIAAALVLVLPATALAAQGTFVTLPNEELETSWDLDSMDVDVDKGTGEPWDLYIVGNNLFLATAQVAGFWDAEGNPLKKFERITCVDLAEASWGSEWGGDGPFVLKTTQGNYFKVELTERTETDWTFRVAKLPPPPPGRLRS